MPPSEALVPADGWISDESSFYGDDDTTDALATRCSSFDVSEYWSAHETLVSTIAYQARARALSPSRQAADRQDNSTLMSAKSDELIFPHEGNPLWHQPSETVSEFLKRCPPDTTVYEETGIPWFWVEAPHKSAQPEYDPDIEGFVDAGEVLLEEYRKKRVGIERDNPDMAKGTLTRKLFKDREKLQERLAKLARDKHLVCGKWLLFPPWNDVSRLWKQVCLAVLENRLGQTAKVATRSIERGTSGSVIIIYTRDCFDVDDVRRVLMTLVDLGIVSDKDDVKPIWYKTDAYTHLELNSGNEYHLPASLYSSKDLLKSGCSLAKRKAEEMHSPPSKSKGK